VYAGTAGMRRGCPTWSRSAVTESSHPHSETIRPVWNIDTLLRLVRPTEAHKKYRAAFISSARHLQRRERVQDLTGSANDQLDLIPRPATPGPGTGCGSDEIVGDPNARLADIPVSSPLQTPPSFDCSLFNASPTFRSSTKWTTFTTPAILRPQCADPRSRSRTIATANDVRKLSVTFQANRRVRFLPCPLSSLLRRAAHLTVLPRQSLNLLEAGSVDGRAWLPTTAIFNNLKVPPISSERQCIKGKPPAFRPIFIRPRV
jgi:hypothetical protein